MPGQKVLKPVLSFEYHFFFSFDGSVYWECCSFKNRFIFFSYTFLSVLFFPIPFSIWFTSPFDPSLSFNIPRDTHNQRVSFDYDLQPFLFKSYLDCFSTLDCFSCKGGSYPVMELKTRNPKTTTKEAVLAWSKPIKDPDKKIVVRCAC